MAAHDCRPGRIDDAWAARGSVRSGHDVKRPRRNDGEAEEAEYQARGCGKPHKDAYVGPAEAHRTEPLTVSEATRHPARQAPRRIIACGKARGSRVRARGSARPARRARAPPRSRTRPAP